MTFNAKRLLIMFSVALNIGFVIMAAIFVYNRPHSFHEFFEAQAATLSRLEVPPVLEHAILDSLRQMEASHKAFVNQLHQARQEAMTMLATPAPVDLKRYDEIGDSISEIIIERNRLVHNHLIEIRKQLGDEKGAVFYQAMLKEIEQRRSEER